MLDSSLVPARHLQLMKDTREEIPDFSPWCTDWATAGHSQSRDDCEFSMVPTLWKREGISESKIEEPPSMAVPALCWRLQRLGIEWSDRNRSVAVVLLQGLPLTSHTLSCRCTLHGLPDDSHPSKRDKEQFIEFESIDRLIFESHVITSAQQFFPCCFFFKLLCCVVELCCVFRKYVLPFLLLMSTLGISGQDGPPSGHFLSRSRPTFLSDKRQMGEGTDNAGVPH